jgi:hypothetical protein
MSGILVSDIAAGAAAGPGKGRTPLPTMDIGSSQQKLSGRDARHQLGGGSGEHELDADGAGQKLGEGPAERELDADGAGQELDGGGARHDLAGGSAEHDLDADGAGQELGEGPAEHELDGGGAKHELGGGNAEHQLGGGDGDHQLGWGNAEHQLRGGSAKHELDAPEAVHELDEARAEQDVRGPDPQPRTRAEAALPKLAGRIKRRPERTGPPAVGCAASPKAGRQAHRPRPQPHTRGESGLPKLAGRIKRRRERARPPAVAYEALLELDAELCRAAKGATGLRFELGQALDMLVRQNGLFELGYSDLRSYALQRCSCSRRWAEDTRTVAVRLGALPALRAALVGGEVNWSMAELVARHATSETDGELTERAKRLTVRQMRQRLAESAHSHEKGGGNEEQNQAENDNPPGGAQERVEQGERDAGPQGQDPSSAQPSGGSADQGRHAGKAQETVATDNASGNRAKGEAASGTEPSDKHCDEPNSEEVPGVVVGVADGSEFVTVRLDSWPGFPDLDQIDPMRTLTITLDREVAWLFEGTRMLVELLDGQSNTDALLECMLAEALTSLPGSRAGTCALFEQYAAQEAVRRAWLEEQAAMREAAERLCEKNFAALLGLEQVQAAPARKAEPQSDSVSAPVEAGATSASREGRAEGQLPGAAQAEAGTTGTNGRS